MIVAKDCLFIAGQPCGLDLALERLSRYPSSTPAIYDLPGPGQPRIITFEEIRRTRKISSRISHAEGEWFVSAASEAPWMPLDEADLRTADPAHSGGHYDAMSQLYDYFNSSAPKYVSLGKISKVLHLKRPNLFPILDSRLISRYKAAARRAAAEYPSRGCKEMYWAAIRFDMLRSTESGGFNKLRVHLSDHSLPKMRAFLGVSDLRLLDMITW